MKAIEIKGLTKYYGKARGIEGVSLAVEQGDFFGFIGPNGAGKSTTIRTLLGLIAATEGRAAIFGQDMAQQPGGKLWDGRREARKGIRLGQKGKKERNRVLAEVGYLPAEAMFYDGMRVGDVLRFSASLRGKDCREESARLCDRLELPMSRKIRELSLGNRKKVGIVCAMQHRPGLYILDEPTSGLDPLMQREFYALLQERNREGATVFLSSHILSEVQRYCRHAAVIRQGRILVCDSVEKLGDTEAKRVTLQGISQVPDLEGVRDVKQMPEGTSFLYSGKPDLLLRALAVLPITDITITEPDLEEVFMHYYEGGKD